MMMFGDVGMVWRAALPFNCYLWRPLNSIWGIGVMSSVLEYVSANLETRICKCKLRNNLLYNHTNLS
jgi:hypothetical protein